MATAAGGIPYADKPFSIGVGVGTAGGENAIAVGGQVRLFETDQATARVRLQLMRTKEETSVSAGFAVGW